jgi:hypothetical protein
MPPNQGYTPSPYSPYGYGQPTPQPPVAMPAPPAAMDATRVHEYSSPNVPRPPAMMSMAPSSSPGTPQYGQASNAPAEPDETSNKQYVLAAVIGVVFAVMIGTGSFLIWKSQQMRRAHEAQAEGTKPATTASASASASAGASGSAAAVANKEITFKVTPAEAKILMDGKELDATVRNVPRPAAGTTVPVVIRAPGYEDQTSLIDYFTPSPFEVNLKKAADAPEPADPTPPPPSATPTAPSKVDPPKVDPPKADETAAPTATPKPRPKPSPKSDPVLPPNPF